MFFQNALLFYCTLYTHSPYYLFGIATVIWYRQTVVGWAVNGAKSYWMDMSTTSTVRLTGATKAQVNATSQAYLRLVAQSTAGRVPATHEQTDDENDHQHDNASCHYPSYPPRRQHQICTAQNGVGYNPFYRQARNLCVIWHRELS